MKPRPDIAPSLLEGEHTTRVKNYDSSSSTLADIDLIICFEFLSLATSHCNAFHVVYISLYSSFMKKYVQQSNRQGERLKGQQREQTITLKKGYVRSFDRILLSEESRHYSDKSLPIVRMRRNSSSSRAFEARRAADFVPFLGFRELNFDSHFSSHSPKV